MTTDVTDRATELWSGGQRWDKVLEALRAEGYSKTDAIRATVEVLRLPLADAKPLVHGSAVWRDVRGADERWHNALIGELEPQVVPRRP